MEKGKRKKEAEEGYQCTTSYATLEKSWLIYQLQLFSPDPLIIRLTLQASVQRPANWGSPRLSNE
jgi:hypothetical protein